jgi:hypothetical protein
MAEHHIPLGCTVRGSRQKIAAIFRASALVLLSVTAAHAQSAPVQDTPLPYSRGFLVTGDFVQGSVDLTPQANPTDANGLATGTLTISGVPKDADIVGAYLYFEQIFSAVNGVNPSPAVQFKAPNATTASMISPTALKVSAFQLTSNPATCWGAAGTSGAWVADYRADVLSLLSKRNDPVPPQGTGKWTGKYIVNGQYAVSLPEISGNKSVQSAGATLVIIYRDPASQPALRKVLIYDGAYPQPEGTTMLEMLRGIYKSDPTQFVHLAVLAGTGGNNQTESISFNGTVVSTSDPFPQTSPSSDRSWAAAEYVLTSPTLMPGTDGGGFGETSSLSIQANASPAACREVAAVIASVGIADADQDGIPDGLEIPVDASTNPHSRITNDPPTKANQSGDRLDDFYAMGARLGPKDLFIEINAMKTPPGTSYGSANAPFNSTTNTVTDAVGHNHMPTPDVLVMIINAYLAGNVVPHIDVGNPADYHALGPQYVCLDTSATSPCNADPYLIPSPYARGGESITEQKCAQGGASKVNCQFPDYPGTVGWRFGAQLYRDAPVGDDGRELKVSDVKEQVDPLDPNYNSNGQDWGPKGTHRRRFDPIRRDYFHYVLYAHARGKPKSPYPCLDGSTPVNYPAGSTSCGALTNNPNYHVPISVSGVADLPGNMVLVTLGLWDNFTGTPYGIAATTFHELGHNLNLWHSGAPAIWGDANTPTTIEPNCKPNLLSTMNYMYQMHGIFDASGKIHIDYSRGAKDPVNENVLLDGVLTPLPSPTPPPYIPAWFAPAGSALALSLNVSPATRYCNGVRFNGIQTPTSMARVYTDTGAVDWNGNGIVGDGATNQNVNYDATVDSNGAITESNTDTLNGYDDWLHIRLDQITAARNQTKYSNGDFTDIGSGDYMDLGSGDFTDIGSGDFLDIGSGDFADFGSGDFLDFGSGDFMDVGSGDFVDIGSGDFFDFGSGDFMDVGSGDFFDVGSGDFMDVGSGDSQELDYNKARAIGRATPFGLTGCIIGSTGCGTPVPKSDPTYSHVQLNWSAPPFGRVSQYQIWRKKGGPTSSSPYSKVGTSATTTFVDPNNLSSNQQYTYYVRAEISDEMANPVTGRSNLFTILYTK